MTQIYPQPTNLTLTIRSKFQTFTLKPSLNSQTALSSSENKLRCSLSLTKCPHFARKMNILVLTIQHTQTALTALLRQKGTQKEETEKEKWKGKPWLTLSPLFLRRVPTGSFSISRRVLPGVTAPWTTMVRSTLCTSVGVWTCVCEVGVLSVPSSLAAGIHTTSCVGVYEGIKCVSLRCVSVYG